MRDDIKPVDSSIPFDPARPNAGPVLKWTATPEELAAAHMLAASICPFVNHATRGRTKLDPTTVAADFIALHMNGRPQDFAKWLAADIVDRCTEYSLIYYQIDRRTGKLPDFVKLRFDKR